ncbi:MAG TPA: hypothetical protein PKO06_15395, partial [Candidatus Ozemobacteraceae bacterium]|nr:hypothetical protein [Candidatus Ozemobacteraceae bacterium]
WGVFLKKSCTIDKVEDFYQITMTMTRKALANTAARLYVVFNTAKPTTSRAVQRWVGGLRKAESHGRRIPADFLDQSAQFLAENVEAERLRESGASYSKALSRCLDALERFEAVHTIPHLTPESLLQITN